MVRNAADLAGRGVNATRVLTFQAQTLAFATLPTDGELDAAKQEATARKTSVQIQAVTQMQVIMGIVGTVNDVRSAAYKMFSSSGLDSDSDLYVGLCCAWTAWAAPARKITPRPASPPPCLTP